MAQRSSPDVAPTGRGHGVRYAALGLLTCFVFLALVTAGGLLYLQHSLTSQIDRIPGVFAGLEDRPERPSSGSAAHAMNILLMGTDRRSAVATTGDDAAAPSWVPGAQRTDALMLLHIDGNRLGASLISIPRDTWVEVPGHGMNKINAAFSFAGPSLAVETVERLTGLRIDHLAIVDWAGFVELTDAVGGVTVTIPETVHDSYSDHTWVAGEHRLDGEQALLYVRQRAGLPGGDLDRVRRQQSFLRTLMEESLHAEMRKDPIMLHDFLRTVTRHLAVDEDWSVTEMAGLALSLRDLRSADIDYFTVPIRGSGREGAQSVLYLDRSRADLLWAALRTDQVENWTATNPEGHVQAAVR